MIKGSKPRILADADSLGKYHLVGVDFSEMTDEDDQVIVLAMNIVLGQIIERQRKDVLQHTTVVKGSSDK